MLAFLKLDPRVFQIAFLGSLLLLGVWVRDFTVRWEQVVFTFIAALTAQALALRVLKLHHVGFLSACVTALGLSILLRADSLWVHPLVAALAVASKFLIRIGNKHVFNPANLGVIIAMSVLPGAWVSPGQWGSDVLLALWFVFLGATVTQRANRFDIAWAFLIAWVSLLVLRVWWLDLRWQVLPNQLAGGVLLLFTFFMISDPMTTPNRRGGRIAFALMVASFAFVWQFVFFKINALIWALFWLTPLVPFLDRLWPSEKFDWKRPFAAPKPASGLPATL